MYRRIERKLNEKYQRKHPTSIKEIRKRNKQPRFFKSKVKIKPPIAKQTIEKGISILKELGFVTKKTKNTCKLKKLQRALRARVLQLSHKELIPAKDAKTDKNSFILVTGAEKTQAGILRSKIIKFIKEINPIYNKSNNKSLKIKKRNEQKAKYRNKKKNKS